jgi:hypothetical protein
MKCERYEICIVDQLDQSENALLNELRGLNTYAEGTIDLGQLNSVRQLTTSYQHELRRIQSQRLTVNLCDACPRRT